MKILILGAAGEIGEILTADLLEQTQHNLVLYARNANKRLKPSDPSRVKIVEGSFSDESFLLEALRGVDYVYLNDMNDTKGVETILRCMKQQNVSKIIVASILGIYNEVPGAFGKWNARMLSAEGVRKHAANASLVENGGFDYTILRLTWLYNQKGNRKYMLTHKGEAFQGAQVTREAVSQLIVDIITEPTYKFIQTSLGVSEPDTNWDKPSFY